MTIKPYMKYARHELLELLRNPAIMTVVVLPILMSKVIMSTTGGAEEQVILIAVWILFAQVMVGIMLTGPNLIEEREGKTFDALLVSPLSYGAILTAKGGVILLLSLFSQFMVYLVNQGLDVQLFMLVLPMIAGGVVFVLVGLLLGLYIQSSKTGTAVSSVVMVLLFLIVSVYHVLPTWTYSILQFIPSIAITEIMYRLLKDHNLLAVESLLTVVWIISLCLWIRSRRGALSTSAS